jgi:hypothetical protein
MNQSLHWSLLAGFALVLLVATPASTPQNAVAATTFSNAAAHALHRSLDTFTDSLGASRGADAFHPRDPAAASLLIFGIAGVWLIRRRTQLSIVRTGQSASGGVRTRR